MRAYCKSKSDEQRAACGCRKKKRKKAQDGGLMVTGVEDMTKMIYG